MGKRELRSRIMERRAALGDRQADATAIRESLLEMPWVQMAGLVACYWSTGTEPATHGLVFALWKHGATVILPVLCEDHDLDWAVYDGPDSLAPGRYGVLEPIDARRGVAAIRTAALVRRRPILGDTAGQGRRLLRPGARPRGPQRADRRTPL